jgi:protein gp37
MTDLFGEWVSDEWLDKIFAVMALTPQHTYQVLTKRPERMQEYISSRQPTNDEYWPRTIWRSMHKVLNVAKWPDDFQDDRSQRWPLKNVWLGVSCEDQKTADERIPLLLQTPASVRWVSAEPLLGPLGLSHYLAYDDNNGDGEFLEVHGWAYNSWSGGFMGPNTHHDSTYAPEPGLHWIVIGGESGPGARPCYLKYIRDLIDQCKAAKVPAFVKQLGAYAVAKTRADGSPLSALFRVDRKGGDITEWPLDLKIREMPRCEE